MKRTDILIVEDEGAHRKTLGRLLEPLEMNLSFLDNGKDALFLLEKKDYEIVILDWLMPGATGIEICTRIKNKRPLTKVMMLTARNSESDRDISFMSGADAFIGKPYDPDELLVTIQGLANGLQQDGTDSTGCKGVTAGQDQMHQCGEFQTDVFETAVVRGMLHNIRTPLSIAFNRSQLADLEMQTIENTSPAIRGALSDNLTRLETHHRKIQAALKNTMDVVKSILDMNCEDGMKNRIPLNLNRVIEQEVEFLRPDICMKFDVTVTIDPDPVFPMINGVASDFSQIFRNIIQNACEAMKESEIRQLNISTKRHGDRIAIRFADTGSGVLSSILPKLFIQHCSTKAKSTLAGSGYGLGLYISKRILDSYHAAISVENSGLQGTTILISIPIGKNCGDQIYYKKHEVHGR